ncbi:hypothetical protein [Pseudomonas sp. Irchel 3A18]|nr:hypothetical protein [Pseudomonas sp. Irchel 3A18]
MNITASSFEGMTQALQQRGFLYISQIQWVRQPRRENGRWRCEVLA